MDLDRLLAQSLQAEEAQQQQQQLGSRQQEVLGILQQNQRKAQSVEDPQLQARARSLMPLDSWRAAAQEQFELNRLLEPGAAPPAVDDLVVKSMLRWFKQDFFAWVNAPPCATCGSSDTQHAGMDGPTAAEQPHATRVEVYSCGVCGQTTRFPRFTSPGKLLESRKGRCGEWAHCFLLMLRAAGYDARHVCDNADHVWNEYWSRALGRWVHVDSCEAACDTPLLYEGGWGKALAFVLAASWHGHADVTRRYVLPTALPQLPNRRADVSDQWLVQALAQATTRLRSHLSQQQRRALAARDMAEMLQLMTLEDGPASAAAAAADLPGRQSGAEAWRQARGETGTSSSSSSRAAANPPTAFTHAGDASLPPLFSTAGRLTGGVCRASGEHTNTTPSQVPQRLFDGSLATKWLDLGGGGAGGSAWVEYRLLPSREAEVVTHYDVVAGEDCPERDPCDWVLEAAAAPAAAGAANSSSSSGSAVEDGWVVVHEVRGHRFSRRHQLCSFAVPEGDRVASRAWRLRVTRTADPGSATCLQVACWNLYTTGKQCRAGAAGQQQQQQLLYLDSSMCKQLQALAAAAAATGQAASGSDAPVNSSSNASDGSGGGGGASSLAQREGLATLRRLLVNLAQQPADPKFFRVACRSAKLQQVLQVPLLAAALFAAGFRPLLQLPTAAEGQQLALVADDSGSSAPSAAAALLSVLQGGVGNAAPVGHV